MPLTFFACGLSTWGQARACRHKFEMPWARAYIVDIVTLPWIASQMSFKSLPGLFSGRVFGESPTVAYPICKGVPSALALASPKTAGKG